MTAQPWPGEWCKRCERRNVVGFVVSDGVWGLVARGRWPTLCPTCFDEEAEAAGVTYEFLSVYAVAWSSWDRGAPDHKFYNPDGNDVCLWFKTYPGERSYCYKNKAAHGTTGEKA